MGRTGQLENLNAERIFSAYRVVYIMVRYGFMRSIINLVTGIDGRQIRKVSESVVKYSDTCTDKVNNRNSYLFGLLQSDEAWRANEYIILYTMLHRGKVTESCDLSALISSWLSVNTYRQLNNLPYAKSPININHIWKLASFLNMQLAVVMRTCGVRFVHSSKFDVLYIKAINLDARDLIAEIPNVSVYQALNLIRRRNSRPSASEEKTQSRSSSSA